METASASLSITDIDGTGHSISTGNSVVEEYFLRCTAPGRGGGSFYNQSGATPVVTDSVETGIVIGTGTTAVAPTDYQLATLIADGTSSGTLEYFSSSGTNLTISAPTGSFDLERLFRNSSGGTITINEVGVYAAAHPSSEVRGFCIIRDLVSPGFAVLNGEYMRVVYTISVTA